MKHYWLLKTEPDVYAWDELRARGAEGDVWDGVRNHQAAGFLRRMAPGDEAFIYHSGRSRCVVGVARISATSFPDPSDASGRFVAVRLRALRALRSPVTLAQIKRDPACADCLLVRQPRLSVMPLSAEVWRRINRLAGARA